MNLLTEMRKGENHFGSCGKVDAVERSFDEVFRCGFAPLYGYIRRRVELQMAH